MLRCNQDNVNLLRQGEGIAADTTSISQSISPAMLFRLLALFLQGFYVTVQKQEIIIVLLWLLIEVINTLPEA